MPIITIDLNFLGRTGDIATYLIPHSGGAALVDPGPETTLPALIPALAANGYKPQDVTHVLLTHIHLDHAGAAGWFAGQRAQVFVHPVGAQHMLVPEKLVSSAARLYGGRMDVLWGDMKPVPAARLTETQDDVEIIANEVRIRALYTPGHAEHHISYLFEDVIFSGDVGGVRFLNDYVCLPFVPPETDMEKWRASLRRLLNTGYTRVAPTHFGITDDASAHLNRAYQFLDDVEAWLARNMPGIPDVETLNARYADFLQTLGLAAGLDENGLEIYERAAPAGFAAYGLFRYWHKVRGIA